MPVPHLTSPFLKQQPSLSGYRGRSWPWLDQLHSFPFLWSIRVFSDFPIWFDKEGNRTTWLWITFSDVWRKFVWNGRGWGQLRNMEKRVQMVCQSLDLISPLEAFSNLDCQLFLASLSYPNICSFLHACVLSHFSRVWLFETLWTVAHQAPLFSRQEYWSELPCPPSPGDLSSPGIKLESFACPALQADSSPTEQPGNPPFFKLIQIGCLLFVIERFLNTTHSLTSQSVFSPPVILLKTPNVFPSEYLPEFISMYLFAYLLNVWLPIYRWWKPFFILLTTSYPAHSVVLYPLQALNNICWMNDWINDFTTES